MTTLRYLLFLAAALVFVGCASTGGLSFSSMHLKGEISNNTYTAQDKSFSVRIPHKEGSYEYANMQVKEQYSEDGIYVSFGPFAFDQSIYRIDIDKPITPSEQRMTFNDLASISIELFKAQLYQGYGTAPEQKESHEEIINGRRAYYFKLTQTITGGKSGKFVINKEGKMVPEDVSVIHDVYVIGFEEKGVALVGIQNSEIKGHTPGLEPRAFAESVVLY
jgi:hypothetical protein